MPSFHKINRRFTLQLMAQVGGALFLSACGMNGFSPLSEQAKKTLGVQGLKAKPGLNCAYGAVYGYGDFPGANGESAYGYGQCADSNQYGVDLDGYNSPHDHAPGAPEAQNGYGSAYDGYGSYGGYGDDGYGYGYGDPYGYGYGYGPHQLSFDLETYFGPNKPKNGTSFFDLSFFERLTNLKRS